MPEFEDTLDLQAQLQELTENGKGDTPEARAIKAELNSRTQID